MEVKLNKATPELTKNSTCEHVRSLFLVRSFRITCSAWNGKIEKGWHNAEIKPYGPLLMEPSAMVLHYAQMAFEGLKAYRTDSGENVLFRPRENFNV